MTLSPEEDWGHLCQMRDGAHTHTVSWTDGMDTHTRDTYSTHTHTHSQLGRQRDGLCVQHLQCALRFLETAA